MKWHKPNPNKVITFFIFLGPAWNKNTYTQRKEKYSISDYKKYFCFLWVDGAMVFFILFFFYVEIYSGMTSARCYEHFILYFVSLFFSLLLSSTSIPDFFWLNYHIYSRWEIKTKMGDDAFYFPFILSCFPFFYSLFATFIQRLYCMVHDDYCFVVS